MGEDAVGVGEQVLDKLGLASSTTFWETRNYLHSQLEEPRGLEKLFGTPRSFQDPWSRPAEDADSF